MTDPSRGHADDLLSAHLDGELGADEQTWVSEHLAACPDCQRAEEDLRRTRALLRSLPGLDASPVVEGILARHRTIIRSGMAFVGVASIVLGLLALTAAVHTPVVEPDVAAMVDAHSDSSAQARQGLRSVEEVDGLYVVPRGVDLTAIYQRADLTIVEFHDLGRRITVFEQPGRIDWSVLPSGSITKISGHHVWVSQTDPAVAVAQIGHLAVTVVGPVDDVAAQIASFPERRRESTWDRIHDACQRFTAVFALGG